MKTIHDLKLEVMEAIVSLIDENTLITEDIFNRSIKNIYHNLAKDEIKEKEKVIIDNLILKYGFLRTLNKLDLFLTNAKRINQIGWTNCFIISGEEIYSMVERFYIPEVYMCLNYFLLSDTISVSDVFKRISTNTFDESVLLGFPDSLSDQLSFGDIHNKTRASLRNAKNFQNKIRNNVFSKLEFLDREFIELRINQVVYIISEYGKSENIPFLVAFSKVVDRFYRYLDNKEKKQSGLQLKLTGI